MLEHGDERVSELCLSRPSTFSPARSFGTLPRGLPGVFRAKGFFWLATRMDLVGGLNMAGSECHYSPAGQWWAAHERACPPSRDSRAHEERNGRNLSATGARRSPSWESISIPTLSGRSLTPVFDRIRNGAGERVGRRCPIRFPAGRVMTTATMRHDHECDEHDCCHH